MFLRIPPPRNSGYYLGWCLELVPGHYINITMRAISKVIVFLRVQWFTDAIGKVLLPHAVCPSLTELVRAICRDPIAFPDPEKFDPQRWLDSEGRLKEDMKSFTFGFGRR